MPRLRVLLYSPQPSTLMATIASLAQEGFEVSATAVEAEALSKFLRGDYDLLLLSLPAGSRGEPPWMLVMFRAGPHGAVAVPTPLPRPIISVEDRPELMPFLLRQVKHLREGTETGQLQPLVELSTAAAAEASAENVLPRLVEGVGRLTGAGVWLLAPQAPGGDLTVRLAYSGQGIPPPLPTKMARQAVAEGQALLLLDASSAPPQWRQEMAAAGVSSGFALPLRVAGAVVGALSVLRSKGSALTNYEVKLTSLFLPLMALAVRNAELAQQAQSSTESLGQVQEHMERRQQEIRALNALLRTQQGRLTAMEEGYNTVRSRYLSSLRALVNTMETGDPAQPAAADAVANWMVSLAPGLELGVEGLAEAAYLHDLGMYSLRGQPQEKTPEDTEPLAVQQRARLRHPFLAEKLAATVGLPDNIRLALKHHHENYDGSGYPDGIAGENIPVIARLLRVVDAFVGLTSGAQPLAAREAVARIKAGAGREYDPKMVEALVKAAGGKAVPPEAELLATVSHELRTPLTFLVGYSELLAAQEDLPPSAKQKAEEIYGEAVHMAKLVEDLLNVTRYESGRMELHSQDVDMRQLVERAVTKARARTAAHQFELRLADPSLPVKADPDKLLQVLDNLLDNAIKYSPDGGLITVAGERKDGEVQVMVSDQGIGIPKDKQAMLFEKFYRVNSPLKATVSGTGLGLNLCLHIVKAHGGRIWVDSEEGKGATFSFTIPV